MIGQAPNNEPQKAPDEPGQAQNPAPIQTLVNRAQSLSVSDKAIAVQNRTLSRKEKAVLRVITDRAYSESTNDEKIAAAGVSKSTFHRIMNDEWVVGVFRSQVASLVQSRVVRYVNAADISAAKPGRDGAIDRWKLLQMAGHYVERSQVDHNHSGKVIVGVVGVSMDEL